MLGFKGFIVSILLMGCEFQKIEAGKGKYYVEAEAFKYTTKPEHLVQIHQLRIGKHNSTTHVINANVTYTEDLPMNTMVYVKAYQLMGSNKYSMIPVGPAPINLCDFIETDKQFYPTFRTSTNLPEKCPITKGQYWVKDFVPRFADLPDELPGERWRVDCDLKAGKRTVFSIQGFVYINRHIY